MPWGIGGWWLGGDTHKQTLKVAQNEGGDRGNTHGRQNC